MEHVLKLKYLGSVLDESGTDNTDCRRKVGVELQCARVLHETLIMPILISGSEEMIRKEKEKFKI